MMNHVNGFTSEKFYNMMRSVCRRSDGVGSTLGLEFQHLQKTMGDILGISASFHGGGIAAL